MNTGVTLLSNAMDAATAKLIPYSHHLMYILLTLDVIFFFIGVAAGKSSSFEAIIMKLIALGALVFVITNFNSLAITVESSIVKLANINGQINTTYLDKPGQIMTFAQDNIITPMTNVMDQYIDNDGSKSINPVTQLVSTVATMKYAIVYMLFIAGTYLAFAILTLEFAVAVITFHFTLFFALMFVPFTVWEPLEFMGRHSFAAVIGQAVRLGCIVFIVSIGLNSFSAMIPSVPTITGNNFSIGLNYVFEILTASLLLAFLAWQIPTLAQSFLSGMPSLGTASLVQNARGLISGMSAVTGAFGGGGGSSGAGSDAGSKTTQNSTASTTNNTSGGSGGAGKDFQGQKTQAAPAVDSSQAGQVTAGNAGGNSNAPPEKPPASVDFQHQPVAPKSPSSSEYYIG